LIAHRWSSIQIADRIAVLGDGKVIEIGTPQDLLSTSTDSAFRRLVRLGVNPGENGEGDGRREMLSLRL
jgi:ABC-type multidrug transport system fused ATPase/permease subunit